MFIDAEVPGVAGNADLLPAPLAAQPDSHPQAHSHLCVQAQASPVTQYYGTLAAEECLAEPQCKPQPRQGRRAVPGAQPGASEHAQRTEEHAQAATLDASEGEGNCPVELFDRTPHHQHLAGDQQKGAGPRLPYLPQGL